MPIHPFETTVPVLGADCFVAPNATVIGDVHIGDQSSVWFGSVLRGDVFRIRIGARTNIQDLSVVHVTTGVNPTILGDGVTVGHRAVLHGCTIEDGALIGMGAVVLDRARVGECALVGAGSVVTEGTTIPAGTLAIGAPARPRRDLRPEELASLARSAQDYAELAATYARALGWGHPGARST